MKESGGKFLVSNSEIYKYNLKSRNFVQMVVEVSKAGCNIKDVKKMDFRNIIGVIEKIENYYEGLLIILQPLKKYNRDLRINIVTDSNTEFNRMIEEGLQEGYIIEVLGIYKGGQLYKEVVTLKNK
ncbi:hypothetical protein BET03_00660 [Thermohalobacter berrensis]|uniref:Uncharacterized protein n=2 Tax=Thermohalobacter berrensis TaxID=99594 RepID=A0A419TA96_9FIRM|nr:hypothetical protein BET03_00660 [Thermohalobacter berrensis]